MQAPSPPALGPLKASQEFDETEAQIKQLSLEIFQQYLRAHERELNVYGAPHLGSFEMIERWVKADGLAMVRRNSEDAMRYLFKAWRARNPKRGLHFIRLYLNLLWPGEATAEQLWHTKTDVYPEGLVRIEDIDGDPRKDHFLTSRVAVVVESDNETGAGMQSVRRALRSALGAKFILLLRLLKRAQTEVGAFMFFQNATNTTAHGGLAFPTEITPEDGQITFAALSLNSHLLYAQASI